MKWKTARSLLSTMFNKSKAEIMKIKTLLFTVIAFLFTSLQTMAQNNDKHILVAYFSATGTTARAAEKLANVTGGELYAIAPAESYTSADLDWHDKQSRSSVEMNNPKARPALGGKRLDISDYDVVFIGYPIWWDLAPRIINTFIESHDLKGKTVVPFATSGGSTLAGSAAALEKAYPTLNWKEGQLLNRSDEKTIRTWIDRLGY